MQEQKAATLATIFSEVLANLAFMFTDEDLYDENGDTQWLETSIGYRGDHNGKLRFRCTREFTELLATNLLGTEPGEQTTTAQQDDAAKEFMNIVCGQLVTAIHGTEEVYNLTIPEIENLDERPDLSMDDGDYASTIAVEGHCVQLLYTQID